MTLRTSAPVSLCLLFALCPDIAPFVVPRAGENLAPVASTHVAMRAEVVTVTLHEDSADVHAVFELENTADTAEELEVGFPSAAQPSSSRSSGDSFEVLSWGEDTIADFKVKIDGLEVAPRRRMTRKTDGEPGWHKFWLCWPMNFTARAAHRVEVAYTVATKDPNYTEPSALENRQVTYVLKTGRGWAGAIGSARILLRVEDGLGLDHVAETAPQPTARSESEWEWRFEEFEPDTDILVRYRVYRDAEDAVAKLRDRLAARKGDSQEPDPELLLDYAENLAAAGHHADAAAAFERVRDFERGHGLRYNRRRTSYVPTAYSIADCYRKAGDTANAAAWRERAIDDIEGLIREFRQRRDWYLRKTLRTDDVELQRLLDELRSQESAPPA